MNNKFMSLLVMSMVAMQNAGIYDEPTQRTPKNTPCANERKKCFRKECNNYSVGRLGLYCSDECEIKYRQEHKNK